jgi:hypothetical protein
LILPDFVVQPLDRLISRIPGVTRFKTFLSRNKRLAQIIPRIIAGLCHHVSDRMDEPFHCCVPALIFLPVSPPDTTSLRVPGVLK